MPFARPVSISENPSPTAPAEKASEKPLEWVEIAAGASLITGGLLLLTGYRKAGTVVAASGAALALLDQQDTLRSWWNRLPGYMDEFQHLLGEVQGSVENIAAQRERLRSIIER